MQYTSSSFHIVIEQKNINLKGAASPAAFSVTNSYHLAYINLTDSHRKANSSLTVCNLIRRIVYLYQEKENKQAIQ